MTIIDIYLILITTSLSKLVTFQVLNKVNNNVDYDGTHKVT